MKKHIVVFVVFLLSCSIACWANVAPEFRHPCAGQCCISGANPGTRSMCAMTSQRCRAGCTVTCEDAAFKCGEISYTRTACLHQGREVAGQTCTEPEVSQCYFLMDGYPSPCVSVDCQEKARQHINCELGY